MIILAFFIIGKIIRKKLSKNREMVNMVSINEIV